MEPDLDESNSDFRAMKPCNKKHRRLKRVKKEMTSRVKKAKKDNLGLKLRQQMPKETRNDEPTSHETSLPSDPLVLPEKEGSQNQVETSHCPTCGKLFKNLELLEHTKACLHMNFEACKTAAERGGVGIRRRSMTKLANDNLLASSQPYFCISCGTDLSTLGVSQRNLHINRCLDSKTSTIPLDANGPRKFSDRVSTPKKGVKTVKKANKKVSQDSKFRCKLCCIKVCSSAGGLKRHQLHCQKRNNISTMAVLALHKPDNSDSEFVDDEILAELRRVDSIETEEPGGTSSAMPKIRKQRPQRKKRKDVESYNEEMMQLAIRASKGDDLEKKKSKSKKQNPKFMIPAMLELSPNSRRKQLDGRLRSIANPPAESHSDDIPSTPALPPSSITTTNIRNPSRNSLLENNDTDDDQPGPSVIRPSLETQSERISNVEIANNLQTPSSSNFLHKERDAELQSPEVSSSNIKSLSLSDNNESHGPGNFDQNFHFPTDQAPAKDSSLSQSGEKLTPVRKSNWSLACNETDGRDSNYRVRNLLSQFDKSDENEKQEDAESLHKVPPEARSSEAPANDNKISLQPDAVVEDPENIDLTLAVLKQLDEHASVDSMKPSQDSDQAINDEQIFLSQRSESQKLHILIDSHQYSDAKIYAGETREIINLHKNILFCNCSELLNEINMAESKGDTLHLEDYTKREIMPLICYIYSGSIEPLVNAARRDLNLYTKTRELMKKYAVVITVTDQMLLDAATEQDDLETEDDPKGQQDDFPHHFDEDVETNADETGEVDLITGKNDESFVDDLAPQNLTQPDPSSRSSMASLGNEFTRSVSGTPNLDSDYDLFAYCGESAGGEGDTMKPNEESFIQDNDIHIPVDDSVFMDESSVLSELDFPAEDRELNISTLSELSCSSLSVQAAKNDLPPNKAKKKKKKEVLNVAVRKSQRVSLGKKRGSFGFHWRHQNCCCCSSGNDGIKGSPVTARIKLKSLEKRKKLRKASLSKYISGEIIKSPKHKKDSNVIVSPYKKTYTQRRRLSIPRSSAMVSPRRAKKRQNIQRNDKSSGSSALKKLRVEEKMPESNNKSETKKKNNSHGGNGRTRLQRKSLSQTIYVSERLPRFKEREHIRSRPEVANMGKRRSLTIRKPKAQTPPDSHKTDLNDRDEAKTDKSISKRHSKGKSATILQEKKSDDVSESLKSDDNNDNPETMLKLVRENSVGCDKTLTQTCPDNGNDTSTESIGQGNVLKRDKNIAVSYQEIAGKNAKEHETVPVKQYTFKKVCLAGYAMHSPMKSSLPSDDSYRCQEKSIVEDICSNDSDEQTTGNGSLDEQFLDKFLNTSNNEDEAQSAQGLLSHDHDTVLASPDINVTRFDGKESVLYVGPVPITPMPDFQKMATPEVLHRATRIGLKKTLSKVKLKAKLEETYLYHHQIVPEPVNENIKDDDDLQVNMDMQRETPLKLTKLYAKKFVFGFSTLPADEIQKLSMQVVDNIHQSGVLLDTLRSLKMETGSIKRGSRADRARCWDMVTPGRPDYDPKISAILGLPEDSQNAITRPLSICVAGHYMDYKKYQFDCLAFICDEMEKLFEKNSSPDS